jgi:hypothetical protein
MFAQSVDEENRNGDQDPDDERRDEKDDVTDHPNLLRPRLPQPIALQA